MNKILLLLAQMQVTCLQVLRSSLVSCVYRQTTVAQRNLDGYQLLVYLYQLQAPNGRRRASKGEFKDACHGIKGARNVPFVGGVAVVVVVAVSDVAIVAQVDSIAQ